MADGTVSTLRFDRQTIVANILTLFSGSVLSQGMTSLALLITARQLGAELYGQYASCYILTGFASIAFNLGLDIWLLREGGRKPESLAEYLGSALAIKLGLGLIWFAVLSSVAPLLNDLLGSAAFQPNLVRLSALSVWLDCLLATLLTSYKARLANRTTSVLQTGSRGGWLLGTFVLAQTNVMSVASYMEVRVVVLLVSCVTAFVLVARGVGYRVTPATVRQISRTFSPFAASEFLAWTSMRADTLVIALTLGQRQVGVYSSAIGIVNALYLVPATVYAVAMPVLSRLFSYNADQAWVTARRMLFVLIPIGLALTGGTLFASSFLPLLLGDSYQGSQTILAILSAVLFFHALTFGMAAILVATNQQSQRVVAQVVAVALNVVLNLLVLRVYGILGAAFVYVLTEVILLAGYAWFAYRRYKRSELGEGSMVGS